MPDFKVRFWVNEKPVAVETSPSRFLIDVLREELGLTGTKKSCGEGECGACTVLLNGEAVPSCIIPVGRVEGKYVTTIEGISQGESTNPIQEAFIEAGAVQCGYCTPGMILSATALLNKNPHPTRQEVKQALSGNICRCTGYKKIIDAVLLAAEKVSREGSSDQSGYNYLVGARIPRVDSSPKATGKAVYAGDINFPGMIYAAVLRSEHPHALITGVDTSCAQKMNDVEAVMTAANIPGRNLFGLIIKDQPVLAHDKVRYVGDAVALVAARTPAAANEAISQIKVSYQELPVLFNPIEAMAEGQVKIHESGNILLHRRLCKGDVTQGFSEADIVYEKRYSTQRVAHCPLEWEAGVALPTLDGGVEVYVSTQNPHYDRSEIAACLNLRESKVIVRQTVTGGGFGVKLDISVQCHLALLALKTRKPVKMVYSFEDHMKVSTKRHPIEMYYKMGAKRDGRIVAAEIKLISDTGAYASYGPSVVNRVVSHCTGAYSIPNIKVDSYGVYTNNTPSGAMRGFGVPQVTFACESHIDALGRQLGIDPIQMRLINALAPGRDTSTGQVLTESVGLQEAIKAVCEAAKWSPTDAGR